MSAPANRSRPRAAESRPGKAPPLERWERTFARLKKELRELRRELPGAARELEAAEWGMAEVDAALRRSAQGASRPGFDPRDLALAGVKLDRPGQLVVVRFASGARHTLALRSLRLRSPAASARLDDLRHGIVLTLADGGRVELASDLVLHRCDPAYRAAHPSEERAAPDFGARIRALRLASGKTARAVAAAAGMAPSNYARLEASKHQPRVETLLAVAGALGVALEDLVRA